MITKIYNFSILLLIFTWSCGNISNGCPALNRCCSEFEIPISLGPLKSTYQVGDTINITSRISKTLYDRTYDESYTFAELPLLFNSRVAFIDTASYEDDLFRMDSFVQVLELERIDQEHAGSIRYNSRGGNTLWAYFQEVPDTDSLLYRFSYRLEQPGIYVLEHRSNLNDNGFEDGFTLVGPCPIDLSNFRSYLKLDEDIDMNMELLLETGILRYRSAYDFPEDGFRALGSFVYEVIE